MRLIFFGSDDFAAVHLEHLLAGGQQVLGLVTGPDRPQGRGMKMGFSPVKQIALDRNIPCLQPLSLKNQEVANTLRSFQADIFVVVAYGRLLTQEILGIPPMFCMNVHGSLLPKYRGAAPVNWAVLNGDQVTGVTIQKMALELDAGEIIAQEKMHIDENENAAQLRLRMAKVGAKLLLKVLEQQLLGQVILVPQDPAQVTWAPKLTKELGLIDWKKPAQMIVNQVRGLQPWPGAYIPYNGKMLKITQAVKAPSDTVFLKNALPAPVLPGRVVHVGKEGIYVASAEGIVLVKEVQPESGKVMTAHGFAAGHREIAAGTIFY